MRFPVDVPTLSDGNVTLRAHRADDVDGALEQSQDPVSQRWTTVPVPYSRDDARRFVTQAMPGGWAADQEWAFAVEVDHRYAGTVSLRNEGERRAEIAYGAHPSARGRGVMEAALRLLLEWGFAERDLHTVIWWANKGNWASRKLAWRLGFSCDGTVRSWLPQRGELLDAWVGGLLHDDERQPRHAWLEVPRIVGERVVLRAYRADDVERVQEARGDERAHHWLGQIPASYSMADAKRFVEQRQEMAASGKGISWVVADPTTDVFLGNVSCFEIKPGQEGELGWFMHPAARGRGLATEACSLVVRHGFLPAEDGGLGLQRLVAMAAVGNTASCRVAEANRFRRYGVERRGTKLGDGTLVDTACYDLLLDEWHAR